MPHRKNRTGTRVRSRPLQGSQKMPLSNGRGRGIRTPGPLLPKQVLYQAELCPDTITQVVSGLRQVL